MDILSGTESKIHSVLFTIENMTKKKKKSEQKSAFAYLNRYLSLFFPAGSNSVG